MTNASLANRLKELKSNGFFNDLIIKRGIEKEFFRIDSEGFISKKPHPASLGSALKNKYMSGKLYLYQHKGLQLDLTKFNFNLLRSMERQRRN